jgi:DNA-binding transcriptional MerR regulator
MDSALKIGQVAKLAGVGIDTVRYYEREGLLPRAARSRSGYRLFPAAAVQRVAFIKKAQGFGFTLIELGKILRAIDRGDGDRKSARVQLERVITRVDTKIADLHVVRHKLLDAVEELGSGKCAIERIAKRISFTYDTADHSHAQVRART